MPWRDEPGAGFTEPEVRPWLPVGDTSINVAAQRTDPESMLNLTRDLLARRKQVPDLATRRVRGIAARRKGFGRGGADRRHAVVVNYSDRSAAVDDIAGRVLIGTDRSRDGESFADSLAVRGWEGLVVELDE